MNDITPTLMVVEDDFVDFEMVKRGVAKRDLNCNLVNSLDGSTALEFLRSDSMGMSQTDNIILFVDINMPGMNGHQFIEELRLDEQLRRAIVFVLTTSDHPRDIRRAYDNNVAGYFLKPNLDGLLDAITPFIENVQFPPAVPINAVP